MAETFLTFRRFNDGDVANDLVEHLKNAGIPYIIEDSDKFFDPTFARDPMQRNIFIKLHPGNFGIAQQRLDEYYKEEIKNVNSDYYLFQFSDAELMEILTKPDEWGDLDYHLALQILKQRGKEVEPEQAVTLKKQRIDELAKPGTPGSNWVPVGFFLSLLGGFLGILIGWHLYQSKKTLPDGRSVFMFSEAERRNGKIIFIGGFIIFFIVIVRFFISND